MSGKLATVPLEAGLLALAGRQHRVVARVQLRQLGLSGDQIDWRIKRGWLQPMHRGVYQVGPGAPTREGHWMAAVLAIGEGAALSHRSATELWGLIAGCSSPVHVIAPTTNGRTSRARLVVHRFKEPAKMTYRRRIPVTTPLRTLRDLEPTTDRLTFDRAVAEAQRLRLCTKEELDALFPIHTPTQNEFEQRFLKLCAHHGIPRPRCQAELGPYHPDFLWPAQSLIVETDGYASHGTRTAFEDDRARDVELKIKGYTLLRFTWLQLTERPEWVARTVLEALTV
ncbi:MAG: DUF559 domain-containing protein [Actinomycetota bacterium]|nr:DUF559 domain-containing protein [Actinomycetota bacterium]MDQ3719995.1 DUF559 domain-containing protein [Actinomycetota bacterium]